jgi:hypothetical protein
MPKNFVRVPEGAMTLQYGNLLYLHGQLRARIGTGRDIQNRASLDLLCSANPLDKSSATGSEIDSSNTLLED